MRLHALGLVLTLAASAGCNSPCTQLADNICNCQPTQNDRNSCNSQESTRSDQVNPTSDQQATCSALLDKCDCNTLDTPEGKRACGLAR